MIIHNIEMILILLTLSVAVTALAKKANKPYPIALVLIGAIIGLMPIWEVLEELRNFFASDEVFQTAIIAIFLPALLGEAALKLPFRDVKENRGPIISLAFIGTLLAYLVVGGLAHFVLGLPLQTALVFGALMAPTDPVSVLSVFKSLGVTRRLAVIMEGESLVNDGLAVVIFKISAFSLASIIGLGPLGGMIGLVTFFKVVVGGLLVGLSLGFILSRVIKYFDDYPLENAISVVLFYGAYFIAEYFELSGVIAVVAAGLVLGNYGYQMGMTPTTRLSISVFWDTVTLVANSLVFILVGLEIARINMAAHMVPILMAIVFVLAGRTVAVYISTVAFKLTWAWKHILNWGGLKGSLSLALALSLPAGFTGREMVIALTFGVVFFSLVVQGLTIAPLISAFGVRKTVKGLKDYERLTFELQQARAAEVELDHLHTEGRVSPQVFNNLETENTARMGKVNQQLEELYLNYPELLQEQEYVARKKLLYAEHHSVEKLLGEGALSQETGDERKRMVLERMEGLQITDQQGEKTN